MRVRYFRTDDFRNGFSRLFENARQILPLVWITQHADLGGSWESSIDFTDERKINRLPLWTDTAPYWKVSSKMEKTGACSPRIGASKSSNSRNSRYYITYICIHLQCRIYRLNLLWRYHSRFFFFFCFVVFSNGFPEPCVAKGLMQGLRRSVDDKTVQYVSVDVKWRGRLRGT